MESGKIRHMPWMISHGLSACRAAFHMGRGASLGLALELYSVELNAYQKAAEKSTISTHVNKAGMP